MNDSIIYRGDISPAKAGSGIAVPSEDMTVRLRDYMPQSGMTT